jgi:hypothetical protein
LLRSLIIIEDLFSALRITGLNPTPNAVNVVWSPPANIQNVRSFNVLAQYIGPCIGVTLPVQAVRINNIMAVSATVGNLQEFSTYRITVQAWDQGGPIEFVSSDVITSATG